MVDMKSMEGALICVREKAIASARIPQTMLEYTLDLLEPVCVRDRGMKAIAAQQSL